MFQPPGGGGHALQETNFDAPAPEIVYALRRVERVNRPVRIRCPTGEKMASFFEKLFLEKNDPNLGAHVRDIQHNQSF